MKNKTFKNFYKDGVPGISLGNGFNENNKKVLSSGVYLERKKIKASGFKEFNFHKVGHSVAASSGFSISSIFSESYSAHRVVSCIESFFGKSIVGSVYTEGEIFYKCKSQIVDVLFEFSESVYGVNKLAVETKRISSFGGFNEITEEYVRRILDKANKGAIESNHCVSDHSRWDTQILHLLTDNESVPKLVTSWADETKDTGFSAVFITLVSGNTGFLFSSAKRK